MELSVVKSEKDLGKVIQGINMHFALVSAWHISETAI